MNFADLEVFSALADWLQRGEAAWLCTVTATWGSSPRPVGSLLAFNDEGQQVGSLSGGCVEDDLLESVRAGEIAQRGASHLIYGANSEQAARLNLPCGGSLGVLIEALDATAQTVDWVREIVRSLDARQCITREVDWEAGGQRLLAGGSGGDFEFHSDGPQPLRLRQVYGPQYQLFLIGVSEVSRALAKFALLMDYRVTLCDPRPDRIAAWDVDHVELITGMPDDAVLSHANDPRTAILALTHDPRIDDMGLMVAFDTRASYIGALGSLATSRKRRDRLLALGVTESQLARLHAPIGLSIGSKTPAEIAVAILAELTRERAATPASASPGAL